MGLNSSFRALVSAVLGGCFAIVLMAGAGMPPCEGHAARAGHAESAHHPAPAGQHRHAPAGPAACAAHLCCLHAGTGAPAGATLAVAGADEARIGLTPALDHPSDRTPYLLPFGHAPPPLPL
jgi:hypothetical protein